ncbi:Zinc finger homeobox protein like [Quillaja saponaria]|uniref:Zinc finger homeobox protein like n=1 Tax=Quillaja saponaria TaxID=32244 RepID=A0AAD7Q8R1_QUISA|nr:Zinc finger homeobox protein like [Quillaja saponaria]
MKRQNSLVSSASRREIPPEKLNAKTIGCMSGIIHLVCKSHSPRKFLTFGKKQIKSDVVSATTNAKLSNSSPQKKEERPSSGHNRRLSCEIPRSPTLPAEIRRSNSVNSQENFRTPPALVARLMGLEQIPWITTLPKKPESTAEKRQKLLGALQKCDEDLKALKKIIESVQSTENLKTPSTPAVIESTGYVGDKIRTVSERTCSEFKSEQQPSPVSVLDDYTRSPLSLTSYSKRHTYGRVQPQPKQQLQKKPGEEEIINVNFYDRITSCESVYTKSKVEEEEASVMWNSKAMIESVEEVCKDIEWGEKREIGRIGLALHDNIYRDLIEEIVKELSYCYFYTLPFEACKRRLCF